VSTNELLKSKTKILIADDEEGMRRLVSATLQPGGYEIFVAKDGEEALRIIREKSPDMSILDISMPKVDGMEVCRLSKADPNISNMRIILLTGHPQDSYRTQALGVGADAYLVKPFSPTALLREVYRMLQSD